MEQWREDLYDYEIAHSSGPWKKHKYIKKVNGHYVYKDTKSSTRQHNPLDLNEWAENTNEWANNVGNSAAKSIDDYIYKKPDADKKAIGRGYSKVMRFLETGTTAQDTVTYFDGKGKKHVVDRKKYEAQQQQGMDNFVAEATGGIPDSSMTATRSTPSSSSRPVSRKKNVVNEGGGVQKRKKTTSRPVSRKKNVVQSGGGVQKRKKKASNKV